ncbi:MAG TPA: isoleucine--tRNA ligase, partial [Actinomycetota bacterium]|nr:isoleucine--tRNA ligase [Actinomycetota bacterium]
MARFEPVDPRPSFPELERRVLERWKRDRVFERSLELRRDAPPWVFYEGPPTANGKPGLHHVEARTFKDVFPRFKTMTGHLVERKAGWDCHGLPVELEVEKEIGTRTKRDIEAFGVAEFNRRCRASVTRYVEDWERLTERIGFWIDLSQAYWTMSTEYVESVWWSLKELHRRGLLFQADKSVAYCPRCGTALSDHEVALGYTTVVDPSVYVRFPIVEAPDPSLVGASLLAWTTTPWTLPSNLGLAVDPERPYARVRAEGGDLIVAQVLVPPVLGEGAAVAETFPGARLVGARYRPPYENVDGGTHRVVPADFVSMEEGTGIVHIAPGFGAEDLELGRREGWPTYRPVDDAGRFTEEAPVAFIRGRPVKETDPDITEDLRARGLLLRAETYEHTYPLCWRCDTPLLYLARTSWYVRTTARKERLLEVNEDVHWYPDHIKHGRYGDWLANNVDWALSRERYWGTPLPIWRCPDGHDTVVGSLAELSELAGRDVTGIDPHKPAIDEVAIRCPSCGRQARRVPEVIDTWYDSGAMPYAQWGYHPELGRGVREFEQRFPADFISEAVDQTRGWFYSLMAEAVLLFDATAYRNVVCLGHIVDKDGRKMSKSLGNVIDPWEVLDRQGADALRWFLLTSGSPWASRRVSLEAIDDVVRRFLLTLWNVYAFFVTYANAGRFDPAAPPVPAAERPALDRWALSRLAATVAEAREALERYDAAGAGRRIEAFVDDLSNWYVRRARRRFWDPGGEGGPDALAAFQTLHTCLVTVATLLAPFTPFVAEELWGNLGAPLHPGWDSVHLADYPSPDRFAAFRDEGLDEAMAAARRIVELGRRVRTETRTKVRQPLTEAVVHHTGDRGGLEPLLGLVAEELNVKRVVFAERAEELGRWRARPNYRALGPKLGRSVQDVARALAEDDGSIAGALARGETVAVATPGGEVALGPQDVDLVQEVRTGWGVAAEGGTTVALDLEVTPELRLEGLARELVRAVQDARKAAGLDVSDRIALAIEARGEVAEALRRHPAYVADETLATLLVEGRLPDATYRAEATVARSPST